MANLIDLRRRIRSVRNTQQITKAMKMVAASKLRRAQDRVISARPYARTLEATLASLAGKIPESADGAAAHPLLERREEKKVVVVVVTGDKGLCGGFNANVLRTTTPFLAELKAKGIEDVKLVLLGRKGADFFKRRPVSILDARPGIFGRFDYGTGAEIARALAARFTAGECDAVYAIYNEFKSVIAQVVRTKRLLPLELPAVAAAGGQGSDCLYEPAPDVILGRLVPRHLEFQLYSILLESNAAEQGARMTAMDGASKNAGDVIDSLSLIYNRARQSRITTELNEIVSGAAALD